MSHAIPARISFNFTRRCNMHCPYCYIPFGEQKSDLRTWKKNIDQIVEWRVQAITFGGGDPFMYRDFRALLLYCFGKVFIHVDTNGINLKHADFELMQKTVGLLGLPLDGSDTSVHGVMRDDATHFDNVIHNIERANRYSLRLKINTVVSAKNIIDLKKMVSLLRQYKIDRWSLYEFWPLGDFGLPNRNDYTISASQFLEATHEIKSLCDFTSVEIGAVDERHHTYFFVTHTGNVYSVDPVDPSKYIKLGSIFDDDVLEKWNQVANAERNASRLHVRTLLS